MTLFWLLFVLFDLAVTVWLIRWFFRLRARRLAKTLLYPRGGVQAAAAEAGPVTVRNGGVTVTVTSSATMGDGSPLTPYAANVLQRLSRNPGVGGVGAEQMDEIRKALEANGMGSMMGMVEQQLGHVFDGQPGTAYPQQAPGAVPPGVVPQSTFDSTAAQTVAPASAKEAAGRSPFDAPEFSGQSDPFGQTGDPFAAAPVFPARTGSARDDGERDGPFNVRPPKG